MVEVKGETYHMRRVIMTRQGPPGVLRVEDAEMPEPAADEVLVRVTTAGVNYVDLLQRSGTYRVQLPFTPGFEGAGVVERAGSAVTMAAEGDRVAWMGPSRAYASHCVVSADRLVPVPGAMEDGVAVAALVHGMTAHLLVSDVAPVNAGQTCLVHAAVGGVGGLLCQYAKLRGATVIATVSNAAKADVARAAGAACVIDYRHADLVSQVRQITGGTGVDVVYDAVGRDTVAAGLASLGHGGMFVLYGQTSGPVTAVDPQQLTGRFFTKASLGHYDRTAKQMRRRADTVFGDVVAGRVRPRIHKEYPLSEAAAAHEEIESRRSIGKVLLRP
jgi:NADPH:quinone reductase